MAPSDIDQAETSGPAATFPEVRTHPHAIEVIQRDGYREFRCLPATWSYPDARPFRALLAEYYSERKGVDPHGMSVDRNFWSGSDTACRLRDVEAADVAVREMTALATRRSVGLNAPRPWTALREVAALARAWEPDATDVHWTERIPADDQAQDAWSHYGMAEMALRPVITGYYMTGVAATRTSVAAPAPGSGLGVWYSWSTIAGWDRWPRRQAAAGRAARAEPGTLRLFISHRWESLAHPDPSGAQLLALKVGLSLALACAVLHEGNESAWHTASGLPEVLAQHWQAVDPDWRKDTALGHWAHGVQEAAQRLDTEETIWRALAQLETAAVAPLLDRIRTSIVVWYDYACMFQAPRGAAEQAHFREEILRLNALQASACTVVLAGDADYLTRAWCFLELCGGMRGTITELTPTWGRSVAASDSLTRWGSRSDQLIGALNTLGLEGIHHSGLHATHPEDFPDIARLLAQLPLMARIESDDSDLVGGAIPLPCRAGGWVTTQAPEPKPVERLMAALPDSGRVAAPDALRRAAELCAHVSKLAGAVGLWIYTTQYALSLSWAARADEIWAALRPAVRGLPQQLRDALAVADAPSVACTWADARALADDGRGWMRFIASAVRLLVIVTQPELPAICRIYERVLGTHLAAGVLVVTYMPTTGRTLLHLPATTTAAATTGVAADVLAVPRIRRAYAYPRHLLLAPGATKEQVEVLAALRLEPSEGFVRTGGVVTPALSESATGPPVEITTEYLLGHAAQRARVEGLVRATSASWDTWCAPRLHASAWEVAMAPLQLDLMEGLVRRAFHVSDNPLLRRKLLDILVEDEAGYALPPHILQDADALVQLIRARDAAPGGPGAFREQPPGEPFARPGPA